MTNARNVLVVKFVLPCVLFALPSFLLVLRTWLDRNQRGGDSEWSDVPRQAATLFLAGYALWWITVALAWLKPSLGWATGFAVAWPILGIGLSLLGCLLSFFARDGEKGKLCAANILLFGLSLASIVAPN